MPPGLRNARQDLTEGRGVVEDAEPNALSHPAFPVSHWPKLRTNNCSERTNREIRRRTGVVQVFPSEASLERLVGAVLLEQAREWDARRHLSGERMGELYDRPVPKPVPGRWQPRARE